MIDPNQDRELQARLLANHPAVKAGGVDPLWRWVALIGWVTVAVLVAVTARGEETGSGEGRRGEGRDNFLRRACAGEAREGTDTMPRFIGPRLNERSWTLAAAQFISPRGADTLGNLSRVTLTSAGIRGENNLSAWRNLDALAMQSSANATVGRTPALVREEPAGQQATNERLTHAGSNPAALKPAERQTVAGGAMPRLASGRTMLKTAATMDFTITEGWLDALERVESGMDAGAVGDQGRSRGSFQFKAVAWEQVNTLRKSQGLVRHSYRFGAHNRVTARIYAREYLRWLESYLIRALGRSPTSHELYAVWNLGPAGFRARGFDLARCPEHVRKAGEKLNHGWTRMDTDGGGK